MSITAMKQALEALEYIDNNYMSLPKAGNEAITTLRTAIEQAERQETNQVTLTQINIGIGERGMEAYEAAKERGWVGLSDKRLMEMLKQEPVGEVKDLFTKTAWENLDVRGSTKVYLNAPPQRTEQEPVEYCTAYYCAGDCGQPHNQKEMQEFLRAQPEQEQGEPVAWRLESGQAVWFERTDPEASSALPNDVTAIPLYTTPQPQREWVGLTDEEANQLWESTDSDWELMKRTEAKLRSKNT